jgi:hypothetical protein
MTQKFSLPSLFATIAGFLLACAVMVGTGYGLVRMVVLHRELMAIANHANQQHVRAFDPDDRIRAMTSTTTDRIGP